ncbi:hypothetical protein Q7C_2647 [Methylophaga frappieri]|uniref:ChrR-like cupin domain-containing protein n=1 Tax=Methylophaga frappieri (strain ATCC BAA-2434 / DSM 25690 / JAM7) TaxID=754477 RepID=I1YLH5_METFJ|nr:hypothetical protein [Methylophaga frappieri]AFJ03768.1 hypothetical protein Q7C_2647 [Methylophaga frappieri]
MTTYEFDYYAVNWQQLTDFNNFYYYIFDVDETHQLVDVIFHFLPHTPIVLHRHCAINHTFVIHGEHRIYYPNGELKEIRPTGSYTISQPDDSPHRECGGDDGTIVLFNIRGTRGVMYEIMDDDGTVIAEFDMAAFKELFKLQEIGTVLTD